MIYVLSAMLETPWFINKYVQFFSKPKIEKTYTEHSKIRVSEQFELLVWKIKLINFKARLKIKLKWACTLSLKTHSLPRFSPTHDTFDIDYQLALIIDTQYLYPKTFTYRYLYYLIRLHTKFMIIKVMLNISTDSILVGSICFW